MRWRARPFICVWLGYAVFVFRAWEARVCSQSTHRVRPPWVKKLFRRDSKDFGFIWAKENIVSGYEGNQRPDRVRAVCGVTNLLPFGYQRKTDSFRRPVAYTVNSCGSDWRQDVVKSMIGVCLTCSMTASTRWRGVDV